MSTSRLDRDILLQTLRAYEQVDQITDPTRRAESERLLEVRLDAAIESFGLNLSEINERRIIDLVYHLKVRWAMERLSHALGYEPSF